MDNCEIWQMLFWQGNARSDVGQGLRCSGPELAVRDSGSFVMEEIA